MVVVQLNRLDRLGRLPLHIGDLEGLRQRRGYGRVGVERPRVLVKRRFLRFGLVLSLMMMFFLVW